MIPAHPPDWMPVACLLLGFGLGVLLVLLTGFRR